MDAPGTKVADASLQVDVGRDASVLDGQDAAGIDATADATAGNAALLRVKIDFEAVAGVTPGLLSGSVPVVARLSNQLQLQYGVDFRSAEKPYVALVNLDAGHATSGVNGIGSVGADDMMAYGKMMTITFTVPKQPAVPAVTDFVSLRGDQIAISGTATLEAFDAKGVSLGKVTVADKAGGLKLEFQHAGIHAIVLSQVTSSIAYDDLEFSPLTSN